MYKLKDNYWVVMCNKCYKNYAEIKFYIEYKAIRYYCKSCFDLLPYNKVIDKEEKNTFVIYGDDSDDSIWDIIM